MIKFDRPKTITQEEEQRRMRKIMDETKEQNPLVARFYLIMEDYDATEAIKLYKNPVKSMFLVCFFRYALYK